MYLAVDECGRTQVMGFCKIGPHASYGNEGTARGCRSTSFVLIVRDLFRKYGSMQSLIGQIPRKEHAALGELSVPPPTAFSMVSQLAISDSI